MAYAAVAFLRDNLNDLLTNQPDLIHDGAEREEVLQLMNVLSRLKDVLEAHDYANQGKLVEFMDARIKDTVYEVEDNIDTVIAERKGSRSKRGQRIPRLESISSILIEIVNECPSPTKFAAGNQSHIADTNLLQLSKLRVPLKVTTQEYVGQEESLETLINLIINEESDELQVISVVGMGGIGKTAMARRIYRDQRITDEFPILIWVTISQEFDMRSVCLIILKSFTSRDMSSKTNVELLEIVPQYYLRMGKFFMVVDDLSGSKARDSIIQLLRMANKSRVLITSRLSQLVIDHSGERTYKMELLDGKASWDLLHLEVFGSLNGCPQELEEVGKAIAYYCRGHPLVIAITAGTLKRISRVVSESTLSLKEQWEVALERLQNLPSSDYVRIILWSYYALPNYLKDCFLYTGMLPEATEIPAWKLTQLWIAEGLVRQKQGQTLEETAKEMLMELIHAKFLMVDKISLKGEAKTCHVHHLILNLCLSEARRRNIFRNIHREQSNFELPTESFARRLFIHYNVHKYFLKEPEMEKTRTFLCFSRIPVVLENKDVSKFTDAFNLVRVLDANSIKFPKFPTKLTQLYHLRYITLSCDELKILPEAISNLWNLQTLVVYTLSRTLEIEADIWKLMHLRFLKTKASMSLTKWEGNGCENLHTLTRLSSQSFTSDVPNKAKNLKKLGIRGMLSDSLSFEKLDSLETLKLEHDVFPRKQSDYPLACLPQPTRFPPKLKSLVLSGTHLDWKHISVLGSLRTLETLKLKDNAFKGDKWVVADDHFRCLEGLSITEADLKYWTASGGSFPKLKNLELNNCEKLLEVPLALGETLENLYMAVVTRYAVSCAEKIKKARTVKGDEFKLEVHYGDM